MGFKLLVHIQHTEKGQDIHQLHYGKKYSSNLKSEQNSILQLS